MKQKLPKSWWGLSLIALAIGVANGVIFWAFEWIVNNGTNYIWNTLAGSDMVRWRVIPLAIVGSLVFALLLRLLKQPRIVKSKTNLLESGDDRRTTLRSIGIILAVGIVALLAGASLGPEASLVAVSVSIALWLSSQTEATKPTTKVLAIASIGALLTAFFNSLFMAILPIFMLLRQRKEFKLQPIYFVLPVIASAASFITLNLISHKGAYGSIPVPGHTAPLDYALAFGLAFVGTAIAFALKLCLPRFQKLASLIEAHTHWLIAATIFGLVIGVLYFLGGQSTQFSGNEGMHLLVAQQSSLTAWMLVIILVIKLLATSWSLGSGYRGGLVFPSAYMGVAMAMATVAAFPGSTGVGVLVGTMAGLFAVLIEGPAVAAVFLLAMLPTNLIGVVALAIIGAALAQRLGKKIFPELAESK